jgi:hypothetical protein
MKLYEPTVWTDERMAQIRQDVLAEMQVLAYDGKLKLAPVRFEIDKALDAKVIAATPSYDKEAGKK